MRIILFIAIIMTVIAAAFLFRVKHEVLGIEQQITALNMNIASVQNEMSILRSELTYLTQPSRIVTLGQAYLKNLGNMHPKQLVVPQSSLHKGRT